MVEILAILLELSRSTNEILYCFHTNYIKEHLFLMKHSQYLYSQIGTLEKTNFMEKRLRDFPKV